MSVKSIEHKMGKRGDMDHDKHNDGHCDKRFPGGYAGNDKCRGKQGGNGGSSSGGSGGNSQSRKV